MRFSFFKLSKEQTQTGLLLLFGILVFSNGGRNPFGLVLYQTLTLFLFLLSPIQYKKTPWDNPLAFFILLSGFSALSSVPDGTYGLFQFWTILTHVINFYLFRSVQDEKFINRFFAIILFPCLLVSLNAFWRTESSFFPNPNLDAGFLIYGIMISLSKIMAENGSISDWGKRIHIGLLTVMVCGHFYLLSAGALVSLVLPLVFFSVFNRKKMVVPIAGLLILTAVIFFASPRVRDTFLSKASFASENTRVNIWQSSFSAFKAKPILGWKLGNFESAYRVHKLPIPKQIGQYAQTTRFAHNEILHFLVELGLVGCLAFLWLFGTSARESFRLIQKAGTISREKFVASAFILSLLVHSLIEFNLHLPIIAFLWMASMAVISEKSEAPSQINRWEGRPNVKRFFESLLILLITANGLMLLSSASEKFGTFQLRKGKKMSAVSYLKIAVFLNPFDVRTALELAQMLPTDMKIGTLEESLRFNRHSEPLLAELARTYYRNGDYEKSRQAYQKTIFLNPKKTFYYMELADIYLKKSDLKSAMILVRKAVRLEPLYAFAHYRLGEIYLQEKNIEAGRHSFNNVLKIKNFNLKAERNYEKRLLDFDARLAEKRLASLLKI